MSNLSVMIQNTKSVTESDLRGVGFDSLPGFSARPLPVSVSCLPASKQSRQEGTLDSEIKHVNRLDMIGCCQTPDGGNRKKTSECSAAGGSN